MQATLDRSRHDVKGAALSLVVRGTCDALAPGLAYRTTRRLDAPCACCGSPVGRLRLNDGGRLRLRSLKRRRAARTAVLPILGLFEA